MRCAMRCVHQVSPSCCWSRLDELVCFYPLSSLSVDELVASWEVEEGDTMREGWVLLKIPRGDIDGVGEVK